MKNKIASISVHIVLVGILLALFVPLGQVFLQARMPIGVDTINFAYYAKYFREHPAWPPAGWRSHTFEGIPRLLDSTWLTFYLIQPFITIFGFFPAVKLYPVIFLFLFFAFSYFLFHEISNNRWLAFGLAVLLSRIGAVYIPLYSSGVVLSSISQAFWPLTLLFLVRFAKHNRRKDLLLASLGLGLGMYMHPGTTTLMTFPSTIIFLALLSSEKVPLLAVWKKFKMAVLFYGTTGLVAAVTVLPHAYTKVVEAGHQWLRFNLVSEPRTFTMLFDNLNPVMLISAVAAILFGILFFRKLNRLVIPFAGILLYFVIFQIGLWVGKNPFGGFMFPHRIYWMGVVASLALVCAFLSPQTGHLSKLLQKVYKITTLGILPLLFLGSLYMSKEQVLHFLPKSDVEGTNYFFTMTDPATYTKFFYDTTEVDGSFFKDAGLQYRFYALDYGFNLNLGMSHPIPQTRGAFHFSTGKNTNWYAWLDSALAQETIDKERTDQYVIRQQGLYLLDWYSTRYLFTVPTQPGEIVSWFTDPESEFVDIKKAKGEVALVKIKDELVSPIIMPTNAKAIGFVGDPQGYDSFLRNLGILNYNSQYVIPIRLATYLEDLKEDDLAHLDGLMIYMVRQKDKDAHVAAWDVVKDFMDKGGVVVIDTGAGAPEKYMETVPEVFPFRHIASGNVGTDWQSAQKGKLLETVDLATLSPLTYEGSFWGVDFAEGLAEGSVVDLSISGKPIMVEKSVGAGKLIWSGLNFFYRMHYFEENAEAETQILKSIMDQGFGVIKQELPAFDFKRPRAEEVTISTGQARGVVFKENNYGGWDVNAKIKDQKAKRLKIYAAGPDFMYVRLPVDSLASEVTFRYVGKTENWLFFGISVLGFVWLFDGVLLEFAILKRLLSPFRKKLTHASKQTAKWWKTEE